MVNFIALSKLKFCYQRNYRWCIADTKIFHKVSQQKKLVSTSLNNTCI